MAEEPKSQQTTDTPSDAQQETPPQQPNAEETAQADQENEVDTPESAESHSEQQPEAAEESADESAEDSANAGEGADEEIDKVRQELGEMKQKYLRLYADFENFRKRNAKEKLELTKTANESLMLEILPVLDNFGRAKKQLNPENEEVANALNGVLMLGDQLMKALQAKGLSQLEVNPGDEMDTDKHEAITQIPAPDENLKGKIVDVIEPGYALHEKVIRYAKVVVGAQS